MCIPCVLLIGCGVFPCRAAATLEPRGDPCPHADHLHCRPLLHRRALLVARLQVQGGLSLGQPVLLCTTCTSYCSDKQKSTPPPAHVHGWPAAACNGSHFAGTATVQGVGPTDTRRPPAQRPLAEESQPLKRDALGGDAFASVFAGVGRKGPRQYGRRQRDAIAWGGRGYDTWTILGKDAFTCLQEAG